MSFARIRSGILAIAVILSPLASLGETIDIGSRRELFVDGFLIQRITGLSRKLHEPRPGGVAIAYDGPLENRYSFYTTVLKDGDIYRMYYRGYLLEENKDARANSQSWAKAVEKALTCYAESRDGIHWVKPKLGLVEVNGSRENNVILGRGNQFCPFIDIRPGVPASEKYKANTEEPKVGLMGYVSADGVIGN